MQQTKIISAFLSLLILTSLLATSMFAQLSTGKIEGVVRDTETGAPLAGAQVVIEGTRLGNVTNTDGYFFILNAPPGRRDITFTYTGYQKTTLSNQLILAGQTTTVNVNLSSTVVQLEGIIVEGETDLMVPRDNTVSKSRLTTEQIQETPSTVLEDLLVLEAGVQSGGPGSLSRGLRIRGGRLGEEGMVVDGVMVRNYTAEPNRSINENPDDLGGFSQMNPESGGVSQDTNPLEFSSDAVEQVDIITGGFQAEYGNAQSGIVNIVTKEGGPQIRGNVRYTTDEINPESADYGYNQFRASVGGPVVPVDNLYFHFSGDAQGQADRSPSHADEGFRGVDQLFVNRLNDAVANDPVLGERNGAFSLENFKTGREFYASKTGQSPELFQAPHEVRLRDNWGDRTMLTGKFTYSPVAGLKLIATDQWSRMQHTYPGGTGGDGNWFQTGVFYKGDPMFVNSPWWDAGYDSIFVHQGLARRVKANNLMFGMDWDFLRSAERSASVQFRYTRFRSNEINASTPEVNWERDEFLNWGLHDIRFEVERYPNRETMTEEAERRIWFPTGELSDLRNYPYETPFREARWLGYDINYRYMREWQNNYKLDFDFQIDRYNRTKLGFQYTGLDNHAFRVRRFSGKRDPENEFMFQPMIAAGYIQNRTDLGDFVFDYGIRYDVFNHRENWGITRGDPYGEDTSPERFYEWSPRFDVGFPVTDRSQLRFSYGAFTQLPSMNLLFSYVEYGGNENPGGLEYARTDAFEAGFSYLLSDEIVVDIASYYRDINGNVASRTFFRDYYRWHSDYQVRKWQSGYTNRDNGNIKGVDLVLRKRFSNNFAFNLSYTLQFSRTTGSTYSSGGPDYDATTNELFVPPDELRPISMDRAHQLSGRLNYRFPQDFHAGTWTNKILADLSANVVYSLQSGAPSGNSFAGTNFFRGRWYQNLDLRFNKEINLGRGKRINAFVELFNALNRKIDVGYPRGYRLEDYSHGITGGEDLVWENVSEDDPNRVRFNTDFNGDGVLTVEEAAMGEMAFDMMMDTMDKRSWGMARQIRYGVNFAF